MYSKTCRKRSLKKKTKIGFQYQLSLNAGQKYCRMLQREHSALLSAFIKLLFIFKTFVLSIFEWPLKTGFTCFFEQDHQILVYITFSNNKGSGQSAQKLCRLNRAFAAHIHKVAEHRDSVGRALDWGSKGC